MSFTAPDAITPTDWETERSAGQPEKSGLADESSQHCAAAGAQGANDSGFWTAAHNRNGNRVVDEKCADDQRNITEQPQIPSEGGEHSAIFVCAGSLRSNFHAGRQRGAHALLPFFETRGFGDF